MTQAYSDYLAALTDWYAAEVKRITGPQAMGTTGPRSPGSSPPPPPPPPD